MKQQTWQEVREQYGCSMMDAKQIAATCAGFAHIIAFYAPRKKQTVVRLPNLETQVSIMVQKALTEVGR